MIDAVREPCMHYWDIEHYHAGRRLGILAQWESPRKELTGNRKKKTRTRDAPWTAHS